jgi:hypothetical protein
MVDGVVLVLEQIGAGLVGETVFVGRNGGIGRHSITMPDSVVGSVRESNNHRWMVGCGSM